MVSLHAILHFLKLLAQFTGWLVLYVLLISGYGGGLAWLLRRKIPDRLTYVLLTFGLGMGFVSHLMLLLGAAGLLYPAAGWTVAGVGAGLGLVQGIAWLRRHPISISLRFSLPRVRWFDLLLLAIILLNLAFPLLSDGLVPPYSNDEIAYHLPIPQMYNAAHHIVYIPFIPYSNWTLELEMLFGLGLLLSSEMLAHAVSWVSMAVVALGLVSLGRLYFRPWAGLLAAALFTSAPMVRTFAGMALIEINLTLFTFLAVFFLLLWVKREERLDWILSAVFAGLAASTKFNAVLTPALLGLLFAALTLLRRRPGSLLRALRHVVLYGLVAFAVVSPWYLKSWIQTGDPLWSFLPQVFVTRDWDALGSEYLIGFIQKPNMPLTFLNWLGGLAEVSFHPERYGGSHAGLGWYTIVLLPFWAAGIFLAKPEQRKILWAALGAAVLLYTGWFFTTHQTRFLMPALPVFSILAAAGVAECAGCLSSKLRWGLLAALGAFLIGTSWVFQPAAWDNLSVRAGYLLGSMSREAFLSRQLAGFPAVEYANQNLPGNAYILMGLYEVRGYYLQRPYFWLNPANQRKIKMETFSSVDAFSAEIKAEGFTHVLYNPASVDLFNDQRYGPQDAELFKAFLQRDCRLLNDAGALQLYEIIR